MLLRRIHIKSQTLIFILDVFKLLNRKRKYQLIIIILSLLLGGIFEIISLAIFYPFLNFISGNESIEINRIFSFLITNNQYSFNFILILLILSLLVSCFFKIFNVWLGCKFSARIGNDISKEAYSKSLYKEYEEYLNSDSSNLIKILSTQIDLFVIAVNQIHRLFTAIIISLSVLLTLFALSLKLTFIFILLLTASYILISTYIRPLLVSNSKNINKFRTRQIENIQISFGFMLDILLSGNQKKFIKKYMFNDIKLRDSITQNKFLSQIPRYSIETLALIIISLTLTIIFNSKINILNLIPFIGVFGIGTQKLMPIIQQIYLGWANLRANSADLESVLNLINENRKFEDKLKFPVKNQIDNFIFNDFISFENVRYSFPSSEKNVIRDFDLKINKGEKLGIIGKTGNGKSTFINLFIGLLKPKSGRIIIDGVILHKSNDNLLFNWRKSVSLVSQNIYLSNNTIAENIAFGYELNDIDYELLREVSEKSQILDFINKNDLKFESRLGERGINLSGGQKQRIAIARALYKKSKVIIFDEATSALDIKTENKILSEIFSMQSDITMIFVAHRLSTLRNCDRVIEIENGSVKNNYSKEKFKELII